MIGIKKLPVGDNDRSVHSHYLSLIIASGVHSPYMFSHFYLPLIFSCLVVPYPTPLNRVYSILFK